MEVIESSRVPVGVSQAQKNSSAGRSRNLTLLDFSMRAGDGHQDNRVVVV
jgi:hypothetical protein